MKKCPYCAEEIQDEAIVCRYCGRDLREPVKLVEDTPPTEPKQEPQKPVQKTIWQASRPAVVVIAILYVISVFINFINFPSPVELVADLTIGLLVTVFVWWLVCAFIVWLWRAIGAGGFLLLGMSTLIIAVAVWNNSSTTSFSPSPTATRRPTRAPTRTPFPTATPRTAPLRAPDCDWWYAVRENDLGESMCVQGVVESITGNTETSPITRIYFSDGPKTFYFADDGFYYTDLTVGDCVSATGRISINEEGLLFMRLDGNLRTCD